MTTENAEIYPEEGKLCMGCYHQRCDHRYDFGRLSNRLTCDHPKCKCNQFVEWS